MINNEKGDFKIAVLVHACDKYELLFKGFEYFFSKYWDDQINSNNYFTCEVKDYSLKGFETIQTGNGSWTSRLRKALSAIEEEYLILFQEDFWLKKPVQAEFFQSLFTYSYHKKPDVIKLHYSKNYNYKKSDTNISEYQLFEVEKSGSEFLMSHQISLWKKDFLLLLCDKEESPWQNEIWGTERIRKMKTSIYSIDYFEYNQYDLPSSGSKYYSVSKHSRLNPNIEHFFEELSEEKRLSTYYQKLLEHYKYQWTHDRGEDPFTFSILDRIRIKLRSLFSSVDTKNRNSRKRN